MDAAKVLDQVIARFIGTKHERDLKKLQPVIAAINAREPEVQALSSEALKSRYAELRKQVQEQLKGADPAEPDYKQKLQAALDPAIVPAFTLAREAGRRFLNMRHFDVQLIGGIVLHEGKIAEMKTGEGKTLVATLPGVLNALAGSGVHIVTVNDYLARRDAEWMSPLYKALGLSVGVIVHDLDDDQRRAAYGADITYGTNNEFGFDYLRDNMKYDLAHCVQRGHQFAIVDKVDSILIDEARTPLIISGPAEESTDKYYRIDKIIPKLIQEIDYTLDEKHRTATLTEEGVSKCERMLGLGNLYDPAHMELIHHVYQGLRAHTLYKRDVDYVVNGILQEDNSFAHGIRHYHERGQPVLVGTISIEKSEAIADILKKAGVPHEVLNAKQHERESRIVAQAGRKGAVTVATNMAGRGTDILLGGNPESMTREHFLKNRLAMPYAQAPAVIGADAQSPNGEAAPSAVPMVLFQHEGKIFQVPIDQWKPVYEQFAQQCKAEHDEVVALGGLHILGTERHEARRIDNQLRGRAGRQGDPGSSRFFLSLEDDLMRIFGGERVKALMFRLGMTEGVPIESKLISRRIENAQKSVEAQNFDARKHLLEYDDVMNKQRETIYAIRRSALEGKDQRDYVIGIAEDIARELVDTYCGRELHPGQWNVTQFLAEVNSQFGVDAKAAGADPATLNHDQLSDAIAEAAAKKYEDKEKQLKPDVMRWLERRIILDVVDGQWKDHLLSLDHLKEGIGLRGYGQKDPLVEFKKEAFILFEDMMARIDNETVRYLYNVQVQMEGNAPPQAPPTATAPRPLAAAASAAARVNDDGAAPLPAFAREMERKQQRQEKEMRFHAGATPSEAPKPVRAGAKVGRNDPCPCGSGKKYKKCHGVNA